MSSDNALSRSYRLNESDLCMCRLFTKRSWRTDLWECVCGWTWLLIRRSHRIVIVAFGMGYMRYCRKLLVKYVERCSQRMIERRGFKEGHYSICHKLNVLPSRQSLMNCWHN